jgi:PHD/YefM family antitoxin component YafN of YafNO toxin-antitoxin module
VAAIYQHWWLHHLVTNARDNDSGGAEEFDCADPCRRKGELVRLTRHGKPVAVLVSDREFRRLSAKVAGRDPWIFATMARAAVAGLTRSASSVRRRYAWLHVVGVHFSNTSTLTVSDRERQLAPSYSGVQLAFMQNLIREVCAPGPQPLALQANIV